MNIYFWNESKSNIGGADILTLLINIYLYIIKSGSSNFTVSFDNHQRNWFYDVILQEPFHRALLGNGVTWEGVLGDRLWCVKVISFDCKPPIISHGGCDLPVGIACAYFNPFWGSDEAVVLHHTTPHTCLQPLNLIVVIKDFNFPAKVVQERVILMWDKHTHICNQFGIWNFFSPLFRNK